MFGCCWPASSYLLFFLFFFYSCPLQTGLMQADLQKSSLQTERILDNLSNASYFMLLMVYVKKNCSQFPVWKPVVWHEPNDQVLCGSANSSLERVYCHFAHTDALCNWSDHCISADMRETLKRGRRSPRDWSSKTRLWSAANGGGRNQPTYCIVQYSKSTCDCYSWLTAVCRLVFCICYSDASRWAQ